MDQQQLDAISHTFPTIETATVGPGMSKFWKVFPTVNDRALI